MTILRDRGLLPYVTGDRRHRPREESDAVVWERYDEKAQTILDLTIGTKSINHMVGANSAAEMWERLIQLKEPRGVRRGLLLRCARSLHGLAVLIGE